MDLPVAARGRAAGDDLVAVRVAGQLRDDPLVEELARPVVVEGGQRVGETTKVVGEGGDIVGQFIVWLRGSSHAAGRQPVEHRGQHVLGQERLPATQTAGDLSENRLGVLRRV
ncbi:MAG: hypothetical protein KY463_16275 [Actinobacteria bacterium]|nr:hypothetical protein [Actinomycetota bacterium]